MLTIDRGSERELFRRLCSEPKLKEWLQEKLAVEKSFLVSLTDIDSVRKAQGRAQFITQMIEQLDAAHRPY